MDGVNQIGNLILIYQKKLSRPDGVQKNPMTNKNVGKGRRKKSKA
jgi:hypothetical protein